jgi:hypothetical protein
MKRLVIIAVLCILPASSYSHPGKTDWRGGHKCVKGCEEWGLFYAEYHLHDKDWKPIRISRKAKEVPKQPEPHSAATETFVPEAAPVTSKTETVTVYRYVTNVYEENILASNPLLWALLFLLLLLLILRRNRKEPEGLNRS